MKYALATAVWLDKLKFVEGLVGEGSIDISAVSESKGRPVDEGGDDRGINSCWGKLT